MEKYITDEHPGMKYELVENYYLIAGDNKAEAPLIGIWGQRHYNYIREHKHCTYSVLLISGKLESYLRDIDRQAETMFSQVVKQMAAQGGRRRRTQSQRPNGVGRSNEQHPAAGNGNR